MIDEQPTVKETLANIFNMHVDRKFQYNHTAGRYERCSSDFEIVSKHYMQTDANDRKLLMSNMESKVEYLEHYGPMGIMGFKMRNGQRAMYAFNILGEIKSIIRVKDAKFMAKYKEVKKLFAAPNQDIPNADYDTWITLKTIGGK